MTIYLFIYLFVLQVSINNMPLVVRGGNPAYTERALCLLSNNTAVKDAWNRLSDSFEALYSRRAFFHWYQRLGMQEQDFENALDNIKDLCQEYEKAEFNI